MEIRIALSSMLQSSNILWILSLTLLLCLYRFGLLTLVSCNSRLQIFDFSMHLHILLQLKFVLRLRLTILRVELAYITEQIYQNLELLNALRWPGLQVLKTCIWSLTFRSNIHKFNVYE